MLKMSVTLIMLKLVYTQVRAQVQWLNEETRTREVVSSNLVAEYFRQTEYPIFGFGAKMEKTFLNEREIK